MHGPINQTAPQTVSWLHVPNHWPVQADLISWCQSMGPGLATLLIILGVVYLLFGFYMFKALVVLNAALMGAWIGIALGERTGAAVPGGILGGFIAAALALPFMKWAVAIMGGLFGAALGGAIWRTFNLDPQFVWAGAMLGLISCGLLCFIVFRGSVMTYMSLQGSVMLVIGILGLIYKYDNLAPKLTTWMQIKPFLLPMAIFVPAVLGIMYQQTWGAAPAPKK